MKDIKICRHCKKNPAAFADFKTTLVDGTIRHHYTCNPCNTARAKNYRRRNPEKILEISQRSRRKYPEKYRARMLLNEAVRKGDIKKPRNCTECGLKKKLDAHHEDHSKVLDVVWVCRLCHSKLERALSTK